MALNFLFKTLVEDAVPLTANHKLHQNMQLLLAWLQQFAVCILYSHSYSHMTHIVYAMHAEQTCKVKNLPLIISVHSRRIIVCVIGDASICSSIYSFGVIGNLPCGGAVKKRR